MDCALGNINVRFGAQESFKSFIGLSVDGFDVHARRINFERNFNGRVAAGIGRKINDKFAQKFDVVRRVSGLRIAVLIDAGNYLIWFRVPLSPASAPCISSRPLDIRILSCKYFCR